MNTLVNDVTQHSQRFEINSKTLFLTYPQCSLRKEEAFDKLKEKFGSNLLHLLVAHELHANGDDHLHAYVKLKTAFRTKRPTDLDIGGYHGNYQSVRSAKAVLKYCSKKDDYVSNFSIGDAPSTNNRKRILQEILSGEKTLIDAIDEEPMLLQNYNRLKQDVSTYFQDKEDTRPRVPFLLPNPWGLIICSKISDKQRHYWIWSAMPNLGKTYHFALPLTKKYKATIQTVCDSYWTVRGDEDAVIIDEYNTAKLAWNVINAMCDGTYGYRRIYQGLVTLKSPLIIFLSNQPISALYPFAQQFLHARFNEIELTPAMLRKK